MAQPYLNNLKAIFEATASKKIQNARYEIKHFFSGAAVYVNKKICISLTPVGFAIKLPEKTLVKLKKESGVKPLQYFPKAPIKKDYVILPKRIMGDKRRLASIIKMSFELVNREK